MLLREAERLFQDVERAFGLRGVLTGPGEPFDQSGLPRDARLDVYDVPPGGRYDMVHVVIPNTDTSQPNS